MSLSFITLGIGDAFSALRYSSCFAVEAEDQVLLVDCPHPIRKMMREASESSGVPLDADRVSAVALTHLHADHASGLESLGYFSFFVLQRKLEVLAHPAVADRLWEGNLAAGMECLIERRGEPPNDKHFEDYFRHTPLSTETAVRHGPFLIESRMTYHHVPTTALRIHAGAAAWGTARTPPSTRASSTGSPRRTSSSTRRTTACTRPTRSWRRCPPSCAPGCGSSTTRMTSTPARASSNRSRRAGATTSEARTSAREIPPRAPGAVRRYCEKMTSE